MTTQMDRTASEALAPASAAFGGWRRVLPPCSPAGKAWWKQTVASEEFASSAILGNTDFCKERPRFKKVGVVHPLQIW